MNGEQSMEKDKKRVISRKEKINGLVGFEPGAHCIQAKNSRATLTLK